MIGRGSSARLGHPLAPAEDPAFNLSEEGLLHILETDGWGEIEFELFTRYGKTLADIERACVSLLTERTP